jgi:hypothetical protein
MKHHVVIFAGDTGGSNPKENAREWLSKFEDVANSKKMTAQAKCDNLAIYLTGTAYKWLHQQHPSTRNAWYLLKAAFLKSFEQCRSSTQLMRELATCRQGENETTIAYVVRSRHLAELYQANSDGNPLSSTSQVNYLIAGLKPFLRTGIGIYMLHRKSLTSTPDSIETIIERILDYEETEKNHASSISHSGGTGESTVEFKQK